MRKVGTRILFVLSVAVLLWGCGSRNADKKDQLDAKTPVTITVWHYYNGGQLEAFEKLITEFNDSEGKDKGIIVESSSQGSVTDLEKSVLESVQYKVGAAEVPNIFAAYADTAYAVDQFGLVVDLADYLTKEEKAAFVPDYLKEGAFPDADSLKIFPVAKSTEVFMLNKTDWENFALGTETSISELETMEGVVGVAQKYYEWTDAKTPEPNDGKAFFGRDAMANYYIIGSKQLGKEVFAIEDGTPVLNFDKDIARILWDNYYVPFVKGYFDASGRFRSDDIKTGNIVAFVGSCSGATFFPKEVILNDTESYPIEMSVLPAPTFKEGDNVTVQQGAGMVVTRTEGTQEKEVLASLEFLKWFVKDERNIKFSVSSGYMPVTTSANDIKKIEKSMGDTEDTTKEIIETAIATVNSNEMFTTKAFSNGTQARSVLEYALSDPAKTDREVVKQRILSGMTMEDASAEFVSDSQFDTWYEETNKKLEELVK